MMNESSAPQADTFMSRTGWIFGGIVALSLLLAEEAVTDPRDPWHDALGRWIVALVIFFVLRQVSRSIGSLDKPPILMTLLLLGFVAPIISSYWKALPVELQLLLSLRNLILLLSAIPRRDQFQPLVVVATVFVAIFSAAQGSHPFLLTTIAAWGALAAIWMASTMTTAGGERPPFPLAAVSIIVMAFVLLSGWHATLPSAGGSPLAEWLNSSGGTSKQSSEARSGVGDGDASTDGENPESDGGEGKKFVESHERSFYDAFTEVYGEPFKPKETQRAVPLPTQLMVAHQRARSHQASRKFALDRKSPTQKRRLKDRPATALLYVTGPTPLHLRIQTYAIFDGETWHDVDESQAQRELSVEGERWLQLGSVTEQVLTEPVAHSIRVGAYSDRMVPLPTLTREFRIGLVNRGDFFTQPSAEVVWLAGENAKIIGGEVIETISDTIDEDRITSELMTGHSAGPLYRWIPDDPQLRATLSGTLKNWIDARSDPWRNVQSILHRLRQDYVHESIEEGTIPQSSDIVAFLTKTRRGPDYLFATAAALLIRELGYSSRLAIGYYAGPQHFDLWSRTTPIQSTQLHTWTEVFVAGRWIPLEPTPGYLTLGPRRTWAGTVQLTLHRMRELILRHPALTTASALSVVAMIVFRSMMFDLVYTLICSIALRIQRDDRLRWAHWLLDRRLQLVGQPRPPSTSLRRWLAIATRRDPSEGVLLHQFFSRFESAVYGANIPGDQKDEMDICKTIIRHWTTTRLRRAFSPTPSKIRDGLTSSYDRQEVITNA